MSRAGAGRRGVWLDATIHAREWLVTAVILKIMQRVCGGRGADYQISLVGHEETVLHLFVHLAFQCKEQCQVHAGEEGHARPGWTTSRRGRDFPWKSQSE